MLEHRIVYEEIPGSRTTQDAVSQPQRERIAYEELRVGDIIQEGDEHRNADGRWHAYDASLCGSRVHGAWDGRARRPHKVSTIAEIGDILEIGDALADAQRAATQLQGERDEARAAVTQMMVQLTNQADVLTEVRADEKRLFDDVELLRGECVKLQDERDEARIERDLARFEVARLSTELWARKPLEDRVSSLTHELANAREEIQKLVKTIAENADQFAEHTIKVVQQRDEARAERDRLKALIDDLLDEPTAKQVQDMLRTWATELDWSAGCFDSVAREQIDTIQKTLVAVTERIETIIYPEGNSDGE